MQPYLDTDILVFEVLWKKNPLASTRRVSGQVSECDANDAGLELEQAGKKKDVGSTQRKHREREVGNRMVETDVHKTFGRTCMDAVDPRYVCWEDPIAHCIYTAWSGGPARALSANSQSLNAGGRGARPADPGWSEDARM